MDLPAIVPSEERNNKGGLAESTSRSSPFARFSITVQLGVAVTGIQGPSI